MEDASGDKSSVQLPRRFVSAQRRFDNARVRDSEITRRLCYDCGEIVCGGEREYQEHILCHEAVYLTYQLYHFEAGQPTTATAGLAAAPPPPLRRSHVKQPESRRRYASSGKSGPALPALVEATTSAAVPVDRMDVSVSSLVTDKALMSDGSSFSTTPTYASSHLSPPYGQPLLSAGSTPVARSETMKGIGAPTHYMPSAAIVEEAPKSIAARINGAEMEMDYMLE